MSLIDNTYFIRDINLPSKTYDTLNGFILKYEKEILIKLFGYELYLLIALYDPDNPENTAQRIRDIIEGKDFTIDGRSYRWNGLINTEKESIISYYVYYYYQKDGVSETTTTGEIVHDHENAQRVEPSFKIQHAWDRMLRLIGYDYCFQDSYEYYRTLYFFMADNYDTYPEWQYEPIGSVNAFDL